jgi:hypothetical protein
MMLAYDACLLWGFSEMPAYYDDCYDGYDDGYDDYDDVFLMSMMMVI